MPYTNNLLQKCIIELGQFTKDNNLVLYMDKTNIMMLDWAKKWVLRMDSVLNLFRGFNCLASSSLIALGGMKAQTIYVRKQGENFGSSEE